MCCGHLNIASVHVIGYLTGQLIAFSKHTWSELNAKPHRHGHAAVMDHMQRCYLARLLAQHEENLQSRISYCEWDPYGEQGHTYRIHELCEL